MKTRFMAFGRLWPMADGLWEGTLETLEALEALETLETLETLEALVVCNI